MKFCQSRAAVHADAAALTNEAGESDLRAFDRLARALADAQSAGCAPVLILSAAGARQAETAVSLCRNVFLFTKFLTEYGCRPALLTPGHPGRDALVSALDALLDGGAVPMIAAGRADIKETAELAALARTDRLVLLSRADESPAVRLTAADGIPAVTVSVRDPQVLRAALAGAYGASPVLARR